jgi:hypothetical protein
MTTLRNILALGTLTVALAMSVSACRIHHLGPRTGEAYRNAMESQRQPGRRSQEIDPATAEDAKRIMETHSGVETDEAVPKASSSYSSSRSSSADIPVIELKAK